jgi:hypothetical protein
VFLTRVSVNGAAPVGIAHPKSAPVNHT